MSDTATSAGTGDGANAETAARGVTWRRLLVYAVVLFLVWVVILGVWQGTFVRLLRMAGVLPPDLRPPFRVSTETTGITAPLDKYGWPDYVAAFNAEQSKGVTPETNFVVALREILGDREIPGGSAAAFDAALGLARPITTKPLYRGEGDVLSRLTSEERTKVRDEDQKKALLAPWTAATFPHLAELVNANTAAVEALVEASKRPHFFLPIVETETDDREKRGVVRYHAGDAARFRELLPLLVARTTRDDVRLTCQERMDGCVASLRVGRLVGQPRLVIHVALQFAAEIHGFRGLSVWLGRSDIAEADLDRLLGELESLPARIATADALKGNEQDFLVDYLVQAARRRQFAEEIVGYNMVTPVMQRCVRYGPVDWNLALSEVRSHCSETARILRIQKLSDQKTELDALVSRLSKEADGWKTPWGQTVGPVVANPKSNARRLAATLCLTARAVWNRMYWSERWATARDRVLRLAIAVRRHQLRTGGWPTGLGDVTGAEAVGRADPCVDGGELIYRVTADGFVIYSVGENGRDDRGENAETAPASGADDIAIRVRLAQ
jgi:hypothetical protein